MTILKIVLEFAAMFTTVFGLFVIVARKRAAAQDAEHERHAEKERKRQVMQAKSNDMWRANKRLRM